ncbi:hypothetical protein PK35_02810 [Tamlana nanhaiensis]|uniref:MobA-like NTP transferase domain-containing protein n=1 Tax=Neotamlana nanhaiensis TaxID=1382798 RepID=A0A0D7W7N3_9FLAO|nr:nucleotidyltransferase family protein [Tamlana nanhaiensis]KJD34708.1 hypothetical protein PK35_02810 [Tamlana nanhaiensis]
METAIIVLAAGASNRMKAIKQLLPYNGTSLLENALQVAEATVTNQIVCVLGANAETIKESTHFSEAISITTNKNWQNGLGQSIAHGLHYIESHFKNIERVVITLADQPFITTAHLNKMIEANRKPETIHATTYQETIGVPVLFSKFYFDELKVLNDDKGAKHLLKRYVKNVISIPTNFENIDIDTEVDYKNLTKKD